MKKLLLTTTAMCFSGVPVHAQDSWTEVAAYVFASRIEGDSQFRNVTSNVDVSFGDILDNLDIGAMGFIEHRRDKWSFIGDIGHMTLSADNIVASDGTLNVTLDAEVKQTTIQGFVGYRAFEQNYGDANFGLYSRD